MSHLCMHISNVPDIGAKKLFWIKHHLLKSLSSPICEKLNRSICRYALGVHSKTQISAAMGELGRYPLGIDIVPNILAYHEYLEAKSDHSIMKESLSLASQIPVANNNGNPKLWITNYNKLWSAITDGSTQWQSTPKLRQKLSQQSYSDLSRTFGLTKWTMNNRWEHINCSNLL